MDRNVRLTCTRVPHTSWIIGMILLAISFLIAARPASAQPSLFADITAYRIGDAITITLAERTSAQRKSGWERKNSSNFGGGGSVDGGSTLNGRFGVDATFNNQSLNENESVQRDLLQGTMTALVVDVDSLSGNLVVQGERSLHVNGATHVMSVQGQVRPYDIRGNNMVMSYQLANAVIEYKRAGGIKRAFLGPGTLAGAATLLIIGAAIITGQ